MKISSLLCRQCGGSLDFGRGSHVAKCKSCRTNHLVTGTDEILRFFIPPSLSGPEAWESASLRVFGDRSVDPRVKSGAEMREAQLLYIPFLEYRITRLGRFKRMIEGGEKLGEKSWAYAKQDTRIIMGELTYRKLACNIEELGLPEIEFDQGEAVLKPLNVAVMQKEGMILEPEEPLESHVEILNRDALMGQELELVEPKTKLFYYPIWVLRYTYGGDLFTISVDGVTGRILCGRAPCKESGKILLMLGTICPIGLISGAMIRSLFVHTEAAAAALVFLGYLAAFTGPLAFLLLAGGIGFVSHAWNRFRFSGEVLFRGDEREIRSINKPARTFFEKAFECILKVAGGMVENALKSRKRGPGY
ncbi:MAG: hypothetical protein HYU64_01115 [Armatimonadetes bacterium]|nr:hypothetical protein [Armatimonadota bacterium]